MSRQMGRRADKGKSKVENVQLTEQIHLEKYKQMFDENGGTIPLSELEEKMAGDEHFIRLLQSADYNRDNALSFTEFKRMMQAREVNPHNQPALSHFQRALQSAVSMVVPRKVQERDVHHHEHYSCCPPPLFTISISIIELIIFIVYKVLASQHGSKTPLHSPLTYNPYRRHEAWRFLSYMFIHDGYQHLISNLIFQLVIGLPLELFHRGWRVGIVYSIGVIAGSLATSVFDRKTFLVGASGGCYALIGAHFATIILNWRNMKTDWLKSPFKFITSGPVQLAFWSLFATLDIAVAIYSYYNTENRVAYAAHFAGLLAGILMGIAVLRNIDVLHWEKVVWWLSLSAFLLLILFAIFWNVFYHDYPETDWRPCCPEVR